MARRSKPYSRRKKTALYVAGGGIVLGLGAVFLWPLIRKRFQQPTITIPEAEISVTPMGNTSIAPYDPAIAINEGALTWLTPEQRAALEWG